MLWFLIIAVNFGDSQAMTNAGPFTSQAACTAAGQQAQQQFRGIVKFVCAPNG